MYERLFFLNKQPAREARLLLYANYRQSEVLVPLDHDSRRPVVRLTHCSLPCVCVCARVL